VLGPAAEGAPGDCDVVFGVQAPGAYPLDAVFTDLDSRWPPVEPEAAYRWVLVHVHGDNVTWALAGAPRGSIYTSQAVCAAPVLGVGGFTDGDRPVVFALALGAGGYPRLPQAPLLWAQAILPQGEEGEAPPRPEDHSGGGARTRLHRGGPRGDDSG